MLPRRRIGLSHVIYTSGFFFLTMAFALVGLIALTLRLTSGPHVLKVAVGPPDGGDAKLIAAIGRHFQENRVPIRFDIIAVDDFAQSAKALAQGRSDLSVIRSDVAIPPNGATVVILHNDLAFLTSTPGSKIAKVRDLANKRVGIFPPTAPNAGLLDAVLSQYGIPPDTVQHIMVSASDLAATNLQNRADALLSVGPLRVESLDSKAAALGSKNHAPRLIPIDAAEGMAARGAAYQKGEIPAGFFRGSPPSPKDDAATVSVAVRLEARKTLAEELVTALAKQLFFMRRALESEIPIAAAMEKPDTDKGSGDAVHPGAAAYFDNNEKSFMDRYGDWLYISAMAFSGVISAIMALFGLSRTRARRSALALIDGLIEVKESAHKTLDLPRLGRLEAQIEELSTQGLHFGRDNTFDEAGLSALRLAIDEARRAINDQRSELEAKQPPLLPAPGFPEPEG